MVEYANPKYNSEKAKEVTKPRPYVNTSGKSSSGSSGGSSSSGSSSSSSGSSSQSSSSSSTPSSVGSNVGQRSPYTGNIIKETINLDKGTVTSLSGQTTTRVRSSSGRTNVVQGTPTTTATFGSVGKIGTKWNPVAQQNEGGVWYQGLTDWESENNRLLPNTRAVRVDLNSSQAIGLSASEKQKQGIPLSKREEFYVTTGRDVQSVRELNQYLGETDKSKVPSIRSNIAGVQDYQAKARQYQRDLATEKSLSEPYYKGNNFQNFLANQSSFTSASLPKGQLFDMKTRSYNPVELERLHNSALRGIAYRQGWKSVRYVGSSASEAIYNLVKKTVKGTGKLLYAPNMLGGKPLINIGQDKYFNVGRENMLKDEDVQTALSVAGFGIGFGGLASVAPRVAGAIYKGSLLFYGAKTVITPSRENIGDLANLMVPELAMKGYKLSPIKYAKYQVEVNPVTLPEKLGLKQMFPYKTETLTSRGLGVDISTYAKPIITFTPEGIKFGEFKLAQKFAPEIKRFGLKEFKSGTARTPKSKENSVFKDRPLTSIEEILFIEHNPALKSPKTIKGAIERVGIKTASEILQENFNLGNKRQKLGDDLVNIEEFYANAKNKETYYSRFKKVITQNKELANLDKNKFKKNQSIKRPKEILRPYELKKTSQLPASMLQYKYLQAGAKLTPSEVARLKNAFTYASTLGSGRGLNVKDLDFNVAGLKNYKYVSREFVSFLRSNRDLLGKKAVTLFGSAPTQLQKRLRFRLRAGDIEGEIKTISAKTFAKRLSKFVEKLNAKGEVLRINAEDPLVVETAIPVYDRFTKLVIPEGKKVFEFKMKSGKGYGEILPEKILGIDLKTSLKTTTRLGRPFQGVRATRLEQQVRRKFAGAFGYIRGKTISPETPKSFRDAGFFLPKGTRFKDLPAGLLDAKGAINVRKLSFWGKQLSKINPERITNPKFKALAKFIQANRKSIVAQKAINRLMRNFTKEQRLDILNFIKENKMPIDYEIPPTKAKSILDYLASQKNKAKILSSISSKGVIKYEALKSKVDSLPLTYNVRKQVYEYIAPLTYSTTSVPKKVLLYSPTKEDYKKKVSYAPKTSYTAKSSYTPKTIETYKPLYQPKYKPSYSPKYQPKYTPKYVPKYQPKYTPKYSYRYTPAKEILKIPKLDFNWDSPNPKGYEKAVNGLIRVKGKIREIKLKTTPRRAMAYMINLVDNTTARSFDLRVVGITRQKDLSSPISLRKFRLKKTKGSPILKLVERSTYTIDTSGEKRGLSTARYIQKRYK